MTSPLTRSDGGTCRPAFLAAIAAVFALLVGMVGIVPAMAVSNPPTNANGSVKVDNDMVGGPGNQPQEACGLQVSFYGFDPGPHDVVVIWTSKVDGSEIVTTPASGAGTIYHITGNGDPSGQTPDGSLPFALHTAGLTYANGYHVTLQALVDGVDKGKTIFVGACTTDVELSKSALPTAVSVGDSITYTLTVTNNGPLNGEGFQVTDSLPTGFTLTSISASSALWDCVGAAVDCTYRPGSSPIAVGHSISFDVTGTANGNTLGTMTNTAHLNPVDADATNNTDSADVDVSGVARSVAPTFHDSACVAGNASTNSYDIPDADHITFSIGGTTQTVGSHDTVPGALTIDVAADAGYTLSGLASYPHTFPALATGCSIAADPPTVHQSSCVGGVASAPSYDIPATAGIEYRINGVKVDAGNYPAQAGQADITVTTVGTAAGTVGTPPSFTLHFDAAPTDCSITPAIPQVTQSVCDDEEATTPSYTIIDTPGIAYTVGGQPVSGTVDAEPGSVVTVTATATEPGHVSSQATIYLYIDPAPICELPSATVTKTNDASGDGNFHADETATSAQHNVPFKLHITNTSPYPIDVTSVTDSVDEGEGQPVECSEALRLDVDESGDCFFTLEGYSPANGAVKNNVATVNLSQAVEEQQGELQLLSVRRLHVAALVAGPLSWHAFSTTSTVRTHVPVVVIPGSPDLSIVKTGPPGVAPGSSLSYQMVVTNVGTATSPTAVVTDDLPAGLTFVSASGAGFSCTGSSHLVCTYVGSLAAGASATVFVVASLDSGYTAGTVANTAVVSPSDATPANNSSTFTTPVTDNDVGVSKTGPGSASPGDELVYTIDVTNVRGTPATGFTVKDVVPSGLTVNLAEGLGFGCTVTGQTVACTYAGTLAVGDHASIVVRALLDSAFTGTSVANTAVVDPGRPDSDASDNSSTATTTVVPLPLTGGGGGPAQSPPSPSPAPVAGGDGGGALPFTGASSLALLQTGVGLLLLGLVTALVARRRRTTLG